MNDLGMRLISLSSIRVYGIWRRAHDEAMAELTRRAAPPPLGKPGAAAALLRAAAEQNTMTKGPRK